MFDTAPKNCAPPSMRITRPRKDGKFLVRFNYPSAGRTIGKIMTAEQVEAEKASGKYTVIERNK